MLTRLPGVGKKTAERLIVEMKDRLDEWQPTLMPLEKAASKPAQAARHDPVQDAVSALVVLGYRPQDASKAISSVQDDSLGTDDLIRQALKAMV